METLSVTPSFRRIIRLLQALCILGMVAAGALLYPALPDRIPSHWGLEGTVDGWSDKLWGVWLLPGIALALSLLLPAFRRIDPKRENYQTFERHWLILQLTMVAFFTYMFALQMLSALDASFAADATRWIMFGVGIVFVVLGNMFGKLRTTFFVGIRTPWTLANEQVWKKTHRLAGWLWVGAGLLTCVLSLFTTGQVSFIGFLILLGTASIVPILYSYFVFQKESK